MMIAFYYNQPSSNRNRYQQSADDNEDMDEVYDPECDEEEDGEGEEASEVSEEEGERYISMKQNSSAKLSTSSSNSRQPENEKLAKSTPQISSKKVQPQKGLTRKK